MIEYSNGDRFEGTFNEGHITGDGKLVCVNGLQYTGKWEGSLVSCWYKWEGSQVGGVTSELLVQVGGVTSELLVQVGGVASGRGH